MDIVDFFDISDVEHLKAFQHLENTGRWPEGFISKDITFSSCWRYSILSIMAFAYIQKVLNE